jgi:hypothetical protein
VGKILTIISGLFTVLKAYFSWWGQQAGKEQIRRQVSKEVTNDRELQARAAAQAMADHDDVHRFAERLRRRGQRSD